jgi:dipeptidyl aminopeptidase/acylaminoacyl peptidase
MYMAQKHGYITCTIDPRGMSGYGGLFESSNWEQPGKPQVEDLTDGVKYLIANMGADSKKVGIYGWSFGGFQTQMCMYTAPDVFTLGIAGAGPTEWQNYNTWYTGGVIGFSRVGKPEDLDKYSLTKLAKNLKGPLMLLHGMEDTNVLFQDTVKVYQALLKAGKGPLVELVVDPTGGHGLGGDIKAKDQYLIYEGFLLRRWGADKG